MGWGWGGVVLGGVGGWGNSVCNIWEMNENVYIKCQLPFKNSNLIQIITLSMDTSVAFMPEIHEF